MRSNEACFSFSVGSFRWCMLLIVCLYGSQRAIAIQYLYRIQENTGNAGSLRNSSGANVQVSTTSFVDDSPFQQISLPFLFPFYGGPNRMAYISPNGGVHFDYAEPCCASSVSNFRCNFGAIGCNLNTSYHNMIAGSVLDLNPSAASDAQVLFQITPSVVTVEWSRVPMYLNLAANLRTFPRYSFAISMYSSGGIEMRWYNVEDPTDYVDIAEPATRQWIVGVRDVFNGLSSSGASVLAEWSTSAPGFYPPRSAVQSGRKAQLCSVGANGCLSPRVGSAAAGARVYVTSQDVSCFRFWTSFLQCFFDGIASPQRPVFDSDVQALVCFTPALTVGVNYTLSLWLDADLSSPTRQISLSPLHTGCLTYSVLPADSALLSPSYRNAHTVDPTNSASGIGLCEDCASTDSAVVLSGAARGLFAHFCVADCSGVVRGGAVVDACNICSGGSTGIPVNQSLDCAGVCFGHSRIDSQSGACSCTVEARVCEVEQQSISPNDYEPVQGDRTTNFVDIYLLLIAVFGTVVIAAEVTYLVGRYSGGTGRTPPWRQGPAPVTIWAGGEAEPPSSVEESADQLYDEWGEPIPPEQLAAAATAAAAAAGPAQGFEQISAEHEEEEHAAAPRPDAGHTAGPTSSLDSSSSDDEAVLHMTLGPARAARTSSMAHVNLDRLAPGVD